MFHCSRVLHVYMSDGNVDSRSWASSPLQAHVMCVDPVTSVCYMHRLRLRAQVLHPCTSTEPNAQYQRLSHDYYTISLRTCTRHTPSISLGMHIGYREETP
jgi:hypothetical protein